ncbi:MAG: hypothetical protein ACTILI_12400, partial [Halomonas sp.]|uniref:hypothetical protein n=1 Tax=Halomonas sp. TaxID=1486246 RepID=UPI003F954766
LSVKGLFPAPRLIFYLIKCLSLYFNAALSTLMKIQAAITGISIDKSTVTEVFSRYSFSTSNPGIPVGKMIGIIIQVNLP